MKKIVLTLSILALLQNVYSQIFIPSIKVRVFDSDSIELSDYKKSIKNDVDSLWAGTALEITIEKAGYKTYKSRYFFFKDTIVNIIIQREYEDQRPATISHIKQNTDRPTFVFTELSKIQIESQNLGQDFTFLLANTPSAVTTSDAGNGVGYTGIRIRGSDATRINVTINDIPVNDAESHGVFWVNMPDLASSVNTVQVQRGVGSSTSGSGSFGANISIDNTAQSASPFFSYGQSAGSFNTFKSSLQFGTGNLGKFNFSGRLSAINSDGFIDRASSELKSFQLNVNYLSKGWNIHALSFGGIEKTYQSWYGTPESRFKNDTSGMRQFADRNFLNETQRQNLFNSGQTYNYYTYDNQTDNYAQNHYQLHIAKKIAKDISLKSSFFTTTGKGYFEEFVENAVFASYGVTDFVNGNDTSTFTNLVRQRWLDNIYYGNYSSITINKKKFDFIGGLGYSVYKGEHFGKVIWAELATPFGKDKEYYTSTSLKTEINSFVKLKYNLNKKFRFDIEVQLRKISYEGKGTDNALREIDFDVDYVFFNPKAGLSYEFNKRNNAYISYSIGNREPVRSDFTDNPYNLIPKPENLQDLEFGYIYKDRFKTFQLNFYNMNYKNQLILTGELNDVGSSLRVNTAKSYRRGIELSGSAKLASKLTTEGNITISQNKITEFTDVYYNYDSGTVIKDLYRNTDIAFSPRIIAFAGITDNHFKDIFININFKYVGKQFLDNTLNKSRMIDPYYTFNLNVNKTFKLKNKMEISCRGMINNIFSIYYSNNGYTYKYVLSDRLITENFYYPQSPANFMIALEFKFN